MLMVPPLIRMSPLESTPSVSPAPIVMLTSPPFSSKTGSAEDDFFAAFIPSSDAVISIVPPLTAICVPSIPSAAVSVISPSSICTNVVAWIPSSAASIFMVPPAIYTYPFVSSSLSSACSPSCSVVISRLPSAARIPSCASIPLPLHSISIVPPVTFTASLPDIPLSEERMTSLPVPFSTRSSFEKITASVLVSPSEEKLPLTVSALSSDMVVRNTLLAFFT